MSERLLSRREVAAYLGVPEATLAAWAYKGWGPNYIRVGRHVRYEQSEVDAWVEQHRVQRRAP